MKSNMLKILANKAKKRMMNRNSVEEIDARIKIIESKDEDFIEKVKSVLASEEKSRHPMKYLMDSKKLMSLDECSKERYLLETAEKYLKIKAKIERGIAV